jgi:hypothetical protein
VVFLTGGVLGAILVAAAFEWALILLSSLAGASILVEVLTLRRPVAILLFLGLAALGVVVQAVIRRAGKHAES